MQYGLSLVSFALVFTTSLVSSITKENCYIMRVPQDTDKLKSRRIRGLMRRHNIDLEKVYSTHQKGFLACDVNDASLEFLKSQGLFTYIEKDHAIKLLQIQKDAPWGLSRLGAANLPISGSYSFSRTGKGVNVYILDSGVITDHPGTK
jgi:subtilisin family serine protease